MSSPISKPRGNEHTETEVSLLTGGRDRPYVFGLVNALLLKGTTIDLVGSDDLIFEELSKFSGLRFLNLKGSSRSDVAFRAKVWRILAYYFRLIGYVSRAKPKIFHILWNNKFEILDRTLFMLYYRLLGKKIVLTVHNVNAGKRDLSDTFVNRLTLRIQYRLAHHLFVHTDKMKQELIDEYQVRDNRVSVIPFGINNAIPQTSLTPGLSREILGLQPEHKTILFFGRLTQYKGLDLLITAFRKLVSLDNSYRLMIAGEPDKSFPDWTRLRADLQKEIHAGLILLKDDFIPDDGVEVYFKAADVLILPYRHVYQSGVLFLGQSFGLSVLASNVGSLRDDIVDGENGYIFEPADEVAVEEALKRYFSSSLYTDLERCRARIREDAMSRHSWSSVSDATLKVYSELVAEDHRRGMDEGATRSAEAE